MQSGPSVSIAMPVYNGERFLSAAIESLLNQTYTDFLLAISDNGSTDTTPEIIQRYAKSDSRVQFELHPENRGAAWNFNRAMHLAAPTSRYVKWAACDDVHAPDYLETTVDLLDADPTAVLSHTGTADIDDEGYRLRTYRQPVSQLASDTPAVRLRDLVTLSHECFQAFGLIRPEAVAGTRGLGAYPGADDVLLIELALRGRFVQHEDVKFFRRQHSGRSMVAFTDQRARAAWFDPALGVHRLRFPTWRLARETLRAIHEAPLTAQERRECYASLQVLVAHNWQNLVKNVIRSGPELPHALRQTLTTRRLEQVG